MPIKKYRVLFYVEPVIFNSNPSELASWVIWSSQIAAQSIGNFSYFMACSKNLIGYVGPKIDSVKTIASAALIRYHDFDEAQYGADLFFGKNHENSTLIEFLHEIDRDIKPDVVICWSQNRYLQHVFDGKVFFIEHGPLPRRGLPLSSFIDPFGHQINSALDRVATGEFTHEIANKIGCTWIQQWLQLRRSEAEREGLSDWIRRKAAGRKVTLLALQPSGGLHYEATGPRISPIPLLRKILSQAPQEELIIPTWHTGSITPNEDMLKVLIEEHPNMILPIPKFRTNCSEIFMPYISKIITISSNLSVIAAILGLPLKTLAACKFSSFNSEKTCTPRYDLAAFLLCRYCDDFNMWIHKPGAFEQNFFRIMLDPHAIFDSLDHNDLIRAQRWYRNA